MFTKSDLKKITKMCPIAREVGLGAQANFVKGAHTVTAGEASAGTVSVVVTGFAAVGLLGHMVSATGVPVTLTVEKFAVTSGDTTLTFDTTSLEAGQKIYYLAW